MRQSILRAQRPGKRQFWLLGVLLIPIFILLLGAPAWANTFSGVVQGGFAHAGIDGVTIDLVEQTMPPGERPTSTVIAVTQTANGGTFSFSGLHNGTYLVATSQASALGWVDQTSPAFLLLSSDKFYQMELDGDRTLSGHVMNIAGQPLALVDMLYYFRLSVLQEGRGLFQTAADGSFSIDLPPTRVKLQIGISKFTDEPTLPPGYLPQWYNDKPDEASANVIDLTSGSQTGLTIVIQGTRTISGHVTDSSGKPVANVRVEAHVVAGDAVRQMITAADGFYQLTGLPPVTFRLFANDQSGTLLSEWYQDRSSFSAADGVNLAGGDSTIDFSMSAAPTTTTSSTTTTTLPTTTTTTSSTTTSTLPSTTTTTQLSTSAFTDVGSSNPYYAAIQGMASLGIISGYDLGGGLKEFRPANDVLRAQFAKMVDGALGIAGDALSRRPVRSGGRGFGFQQPPSEPLPTAPPPGRVDRPPRPLPSHHRPGLGPPLCLRPLFGRPSRAPGTRSTRRRRTSPRAAPSRSSQRHSHPSAVRRA